MKTWTRSWTYVIAAAILHAAGMIRLRVLVFSVLVASAGCQPRPDPEPLPVEAPEQIRAEVKSLTDPQYLTYTVTNTQTLTSSGTATNTITSTSTITNTNTVTNTITSTSTKTNTQTVTGTNTYPDTATLTASYTTTKTGTSSATASTSKTATGTATYTGTYLATGTSTGTKTATGTLTGTNTLTGSMTVTGSGTGTKTGTKTVSGTAVGTGSQTVTQTYASTSSSTGTATATATSTKTSTATATKTTTSTSTATGTATTTSANACYGTWNFCDNFESGNSSQWSHQQGGWSDFTVVTDGTKVYQQGNTYASGWDIYMAGSKWMDQSVEAKLKALTLRDPTTMVALFGRDENVINGGDCAYFAGLRGDGAFVLGKRVNGTTSVLASTNQGVVTGTWYTLKLNMTGTTVTAYLNGTQLLSQNDNDCQGGSVGVGSLNATFEADDVRVTAASTNTCIQGWRNTTCDMCTGQTQEDRKQCWRFLDCYANHGCGPETCGGDDDFCGVHQAGNPANPDDPTWPQLNAWGMAPKTIADQVYKCKGCSGSVRCDLPAKPDWTGCADGNACTTYDSCQQGVCVGQSPVTCQALDQCHDAGTCAPLTGVCSNPNKVDGTACDDGSACTQTDSCQAGVCTGTNPIICDPNNNPCHENVCNGATGTCQDQQKQDGTTCNDSDACTQTDVCLNGACTGTNPVACTASDSCHGVGTCDSSTGVCSDPPLDKIGCNVNLRDVDGVVDMGNGNWIALFGWDSTATTPFHPTTNTISVDTGQVPSTSPNPPAYLIPGSHPGGFLAHFTTGQTISWTVDTQTKSASNKISTQLTPKPLPSGGGQQVTLGNGTTVVVTPDMGAYTAPPSDPAPNPAPEPKAVIPFNGALMGSLTVGPTGAALYTVPISIPPGVAGMAPNLNLVYSNQASSGIAGQGWDLTGLSTIYRCPKTVLQDGYAKALAMDRNDFSQTNGDGLCIDGKRLLWLSSSLSGDSATFTTEFADFSKITLFYDDFGAPSDPQGRRQATHFTVVTKSGETRYYGSREDARLYLPMEDANGIVGTGETVPAIWALDQVVDVWGNFYEIHYNDDKGNNQDSTSSPSDFQTRGLIPTSIAYSGHIDANSGEADVLPPNTITFTYASRKEVRNTRFRDSVVSRSMVLSQIASSRGTYGLDYAGPSLDLGASLDSDKLFAISFVQPGGNTACLSPLTIYDPKQLAADSCLKPLVFGWDIFNPSGTGSMWEESSSYALPADYSGTGTQLVDLDGDGRLDFVQAIQGKAFKTWRNTGAGWEEKSTWQMPASLAHSDGSAAGTIFMDIDGDGLPDLITSESPQNIWLNRLRQDQGGTWQLQTTGNYSINNLYKVTSAGFFTLDPATFGGGYFQAADINGDGRLELVEVMPVASGVFDLVVLSNDGTGWKSARSGDLGVDQPPATFVVRDVDRDGLADLVASDGSRIWFNPGGPIANGTPFDWRMVTSDKVALEYVVGRGDIDGDGVIDQVSISTSVDALDKTRIYPTGKVGVSLMSGSGLVGTSGGSSSGVEGYADALNMFSFGPDWNAFIGNSEAGRFQLADINGDGLADVVLNHAWGGAVLINRNGEFRDVGQISNHPNWPVWGQPQSSDPPFVDTAPAANQNWIIPTALAPSGIVAVADNKSTYPLDVFVDIDGDGIVDRVQSLMHCNPKDSSCTTPYVKKTFLNKYHRPVITTFPNGLAQPSQVSYSVTTKGEIYSDGAPRTGGTSYLAAPIQVVKSVTTDNGIGSVSSTTSYMYSSLRASARQHTPLGFQEVWTTGPDGTFTDTTYLQGYPYQGRVSTVVRTKPGVGVVNETDTVYNQDVAITPEPGRGIFVHPFRVTDTTSLYGQVRGDGTAAQTGEVTTVTLYDFDDYGNMKSTTVTTTDSSAGGGAGTGGSGGSDGGTGGTGGSTTSNGGESYQRTVVNHYPTDGGLAQQRGKANQTIVSTTKLVGANSGNSSTITHTTDFEYGPGPIFKLLKKKTELGSGFPTEMHTAYDYDPFGNVITTTSCASDFDSCTAGALNPGDTSKPEHPPFRSTLTSYDPKQFSPGAVAPTQTLGYSEKGRFPVKTTNAAGHVEYTAYDPSLGVLIQNTGPNGIVTCYGYDSLGRKRSEIARCGTNSALTTTSDPFVAPGADSQFAAVVTVTRPPSGAATWAYTDALGRPVEALGRSFAGSFTETLTTYDALGRTAKTSKPFLTGNPVYWSTPTYDSLDRVIVVTEDLGSIDGISTSAKGGSASNVVTTDFEGFTSIITTTVNGQTRSRTEIKNVLGKIASIKDAKGSTISYDYDAEGNLTYTHDPAGNSVHITYDLRGRKKTSTDPDLGSWTYDYNGFGELIGQTDAKKQKTALTYDVLGRMASKTYLPDTSEASTSTWIYDVATGAALGKLAAVIGPPDSRLKKACVAPTTVPSTVDTSGNRPIRWYAYNPFGDVSEVSECTDGETYATDYTYDSNGRQSIVTYPEVAGARFAVQYNYSSFGFLQYVNDVSSGDVYWQAKSVNATGQVTDEQNGNGVETVSTINPSTGWLLNQTVTSHADADNLIQGLNFKFDEAGNLLGRTRTEPRDMVDSNETFGYDQLDRLISSELKVPAQDYDVTESFAFDSLGLGNLTQKNGKFYTYTGCAAGGGPHTVCQVDGGPAYSYDANGNMVSGNGHTAAYTAFNKVSHIEGTSAPGGSSPTVDFVYEADGNRVLQTTGTTTGPETARTVYVGLGETGKSIYERTMTSAGIQHVHFIYAGNAHRGNAFALRIATQTSSDATATYSTKYNHFDHLGSTTATSDESGQVMGPAWGGAATTVYSYDAWGLKRSPDGRPATTIQSPAAGNREYTGQEAIPGVTLVNMNGRVYDPQLGRFLSPDPNVQFVADLQSYNRYSYVRNNPLRLTDPTGYAWYGFVSSPQFWIAAMEAAAMIVCTVATEGGCAPLAIALLVQNSVQMLAEGVPLWQVAAVDAASYFGGEIGGQLGGAVAPTVGNGMGQVVGGAIGGAVTAAMTTEIVGGNLGTNVLYGALNGAATAALTVSLQGMNPLSVADWQEQQGGGAYKKFIGDLDNPQAQALEGELKAHPLLTYEDENGYSQLTKYWRDKLQPFYEGRNLDLGEVWVHSVDLAGDAVGMVDYGAQSRVINIDRSLGSNSIYTLDTYVHESMHLVEGDLIGSNGMAWRKASDMLRFGPSDNSQYNWRGYSDLYGASYNQISATGGGSYPIEAGFDRFSHDVVNNLAACGAVCP